MESIFSLDVKHNLKLKNVQIGFWNSLEVTRMVKFNIILFEFKTKNSVDFFFFQNGNRSNSTTKD